MKISYRSKLVWNPVQGGHMNTVVGDVYDLEIDGIPYVPPAPEPVQPKLTPREPTDKMLIFGFRCDDGLLVSHKQAAEIWRDMWDAAPAGPEPDATGGKHG